MDFKWLFREARASGTQLDSTQSEKDATRFEHLLRRNFWLSDKTGDSRLLWLFVAPLELDSTLSKEQQITRRLASVWLPERRRRCCASFDFKYKYAVVFGYLL